MSFIDKLYNLKKNLIKNIKQFYTAYFTVEGTYTSLLPDKIYIKKLYKKLMGKELNLKNPVTFNEKLNWIKLYDRRPEYTIMADKYRARDYIKEKIGEEYLVPLLGVYEKAEEIDFDALPNQFVLKCNHASDVVVCRDKGNNDFFCKKGKLGSICEVRAYLEKGLKTNFYKASREWPYKCIKRKIICEKYLENEDGSQLLEYNVFCFNGMPRFFKASTRTSDDSMIKTFYDMDWKWMDLSTGVMAGDIFEKPAQLEEMLRVSKVLSAGVPHLRVDFFVCNGRLYSGELTFFSAGGFWKVEPQEWDNVFGEYMQLPEKHNR